MLYVETHGQAGSPVLLLHGFGLSRYLWRFWTPELSREHRTLAVDLKGFGDAPKPKDRAYGPQHQAILVRDLILEEDLRNLTLVGHSIGGAVALLTHLLLHDLGDERVTRLILVGPAALPMPVPPYIRRAGLPFLGRFFLRLIPARFIMREALLVAYHDPEQITQGAIDAYAEPLRRAGGRYALSWSARQLLPPDIGTLIQRLPEIDVPTLLLWGARDRVVPPRFGEELERILPRAQLKVLPQCGHMLPEEKPEDGLEIVRSFMGEGVS